VKLADAGTKAVLQGGANDLGGTLMEETISRMAGSENGSLKTIAELEAMAAAIGRPARQRTTEYGTPSDERLATARSEEGRARLTLSVTPARCTARTGWCTSW
jgi:FO synthase